MGLVKLSPSVCFTYTTAKYLHTGSGIFYCLIQSIHSPCDVFQVDGLGTYSNVAVYAALVLSCMFLPTFIIKTFTVKWGLVMCMFCYTAYIATQFYPQFYTIIPGAIIVGIGAAPMWSAKCTYLTQVRISKISIKRLHVHK